MLTEFQKKKLLYLFRFLDYNKNSYLQLEDFSDIGLRVCEKRDIEFGSRHHKKVMDKCVKTYHRILKDMSGKGNQFVLPEEWANFIGKEIVHASDEIYLHDYVELVMEYVFGLTDENKDGFISREEYMEIFTTFGVAPGRSEQAFAHMDVNKDGKLSRYEVKHAIETFLVSDDPQDNANWVFGDWNVDPWEEDQ